METIETIELLFDLTILNSELSDPENEKTDLDIRGLKILVFEMFPSTNEIKNHFYFAVGNPEKYSLYAKLKNGGYKEIWKDK